MSGDAENPNNTRAAQGVIGAVTIIEHPSHSAATIIESAGGTPTLIESETPDSVPNHSNNLIAGAQVLGCTLLEPIRVTSGEADLWLANRQQQRVVVKVYRWNIHPNAEIAVLLKQADCNHVVALLDCGSLPDGRSVEVLEYIPGGTLAPLLPRAAADEDFRLELVRQLADAINALHTTNLMHRDIKPANILVRTIQPLDLVLADFGISSVTDLDLHKTTRDRTVPYSAPESTQGVVSRGSDWWSMGVILLEIFLGRHPFAGLDDLTINVQLVSRPMPLPNDWSPRWRTLVAGLLTKDHENRWKFDQVNRWLAGEENIPVLFESANTLATAANTTKPYRFEKREYFDVTSLAVALAESPSEGSKRIVRGTVSGWLAAQLGNHDLASQLEDLREDMRLKPGEKLALAVMLMNPDLPLFINGKVASPDWLSGDLSSGIALIEGPIPDWLQKHRNDCQYLEIRARRKKLHATLKRSGIAYEELLADRLAFSRPADIVARAEQDRKPYARATNTVLDAALHESPLLELTAGLLLAANRSYFIPWKQHFDECSADLLTRLKNLDQLMDEDRTATTRTKLQSYLAGAEKLDQQFNQLRTSCEGHLPLASEATAALEKLLASCRSRAETQLQEHTEHQQLLDMALRGEVATVRNRLAHRSFSDIDYDKVEKALQEWPRAIIELQALIDEQMPKGSVVPKASILQRDEEFLGKQAALADFLEQIAPQVVELEQDVGNQRGTEVFEESRLGVAKLRRSFDWLRDFAKAQARA